MSSDTTSPNRLYFAAWRWHFHAGLYVIPFLRRRAKDPLLACGLGLTLLAAIVFDLVILTAIRP